MSRSEGVRTLIQDGRLTRLEPRLSNARRERGIVLAPYLHERFLERSGEAPRWASMRADLDRFIAGGRITIGSKRHRTCFMKQLDPVEENVWESRHRDPNPGLRGFGMFCDLDTFFVASFREREELGGWNDKEWRDEVNRAKAAWRGVFTSYEPISGERISDCISGRVLDEREWDAPQGGKRRRPRVLPRASSQYDS